MDPDDPLRVLWCHFELLPDITNGIIEADAGTDPALRHLIDAWRLLADLPMPGNEIKALITVILCLLDRSAGFRFADFAVEDIERYINDHLSGKLDVDMLARQFGYTRSHFTRKFTEAFGLPPGDYLRVVRMSRASVMILSGSSLEEICSQTGFSDKKAFTRAFGKYYGTSPSQFRKQYGHSQ